MATYCQSVSQERRSSAVPRAWFHIMSGLACAVIVCVIVAKQFEMREGSGFGNALGSRTVYERGWPFAFETGVIWRPALICLHDGSVVQPLAKECRKADSVSWAVAGFQCATLLTFGCGCACVFFADRSLKSRMQISLRGL